MRELILLVTFSLSLQFATVINSVSIEDFYPFGEAVGDLKVPHGKHATGSVLHLNCSYQFYNTVFAELRVSISPV